MTSAEGWDQSLYYEDLEVGMVLTSLGRTVTEPDLVNFSMISGDWNPIHSDEEFARGTAYGKRVVHGVFGLSLLTGLMDRAGWFATSAIAMLDITRWRFAKPIFVGDTLHCELEISSLRLTSSGAKGVVGRLFRLINQRGETVQEGEIPMLVRIRGSDQ
ncbi:MaoC/PaaZ C-terminal domain-containing protein [Prauserella flavalba]|uniref:Dehydratase n=1 Tax=Prauserella flavalba TaxID=1477506 RepID=A0A318LC17_9PSEU|nr:MaoC/PaaZ C-terminal domain-containing protein [Prauserella flavalba]PXY21498.1 dehydratase [Prauserella flavalba]